MLGTSNIIWNLINFIALIFLLVKFLKKPVTDAVEKKRDSISNRLDDLESKLNSATEKLNHQNKQLEEVKVDLKKIEEQSKDMAEKNKGIGKNFNFTNDKNKIENNCCFKKETAFENKKATETSSNTIQLVDKSTSKNLNRSLSSRNLITRSETSDYGNDFEMSSINRKKIFFATKNTTGLTININHDKNGNIKESNFSYNINVEKISKNKTPDFLIGKLHKRFDDFLIDLKKENPDVNIDNKSVKNYISASVEKLFKEKDSIFKKGDLKEKKYDSINIELSIPTSVPGLSVTAQINATNSNMIQINLPLEKNSNGALAPKEEESSINASIKKEIGAGAGINYSPYAPIELNLKAKYNYNHEESSNLAIIDKSNVFVYIPAKIKSWEEQKNISGLKLENVNSILAEIKNEKNSLMKIDTNISKTDLEKKLSDIETDFINKFNSILREDINSLNTRKNDITQNIKDSNNYNEINTIKEKLIPELKNSNDLTQKNIKNLESLNLKINDENSKGLVDLDLEISNLSKIANDKESLFFLIDDLEERASFLATSNYKNTNITNKIKNTIACLNIKEDVKAINSEIKNIDDNEINNKMKKEASSNCLSISNDADLKIEEFKKDISNNIEKYVFDNQKKITNLFDEAMKPNIKSTEVSNIKEKLIELQKSMESDFSELDKIPSVENLLDKLEGMNSNINNIVSTISKKEENLKNQEIISNHEKLLKDLSIKIENNKSKNTELSTLNLDLNNISKNLDDISKELKEIKSLVNNKELESDIDKNISKSNNLSNKSKNLEKLSSNFMALNTSIKELDVLNGKVKKLNNDFIGSLSQKQKKQEIKNNLQEIKNNMSEIEKTINSISENNDKNLRTRINTCNNSLNSLKTSIKLIENRLENSYR